VKNGTDCCLSSAGSSPAIAECDGDYHHDSRKNVLTWSLPIIDATNKAGALEFSVPASIPGDFFPLQVQFTSKISYAEVKATKVVMIDDETEQPVKYSTETLLYADTYEVV
jgi:coatomer subunit delta